MRALFILLFICIAVTSNAYADDVTNPLVAEHCAGKSSALLFVTPKCRACQKVENDLDRMVKNNPELCIILVAPKNTKTETLIADLDKNKIDLPATIDEGGKFFEAFKIEDIPVLLLFDKKAKMTERFDASNIPGSDKILRHMLRNDEKN